MRATLNASAFRIRSASVGLGACHAAICSYGGMTVIVVALAFGLSGHPCSVHADRARLNCKALLT
jgi:hypothetical protein